MRRLKVYPGEVHHVCQQTIGGFLLFYTVSDYLVFLTIYCTVARRMDLKVLALCPMVDHLHNTVIVPDSRTLSKFVQQYTHLFAEEWNTSRGRRGPLFKHRYMVSAKIGNKQVRTTINYNNNNPVERKLVQKAEEYRWNFLRYAREKNPYSVPYRLSDKSQMFRNILREVRRIHAGGGHLLYSQLERWKKRLKPGEMQQLADYIITLWNVIDYPAAISYYGDYDAMLRSFHDNTGADYDIREDHDNYSDAVYKECTEVVLKTGTVKSLYELPSLSQEDKLALAETLQRRTTARPRQIEKYLHLKQK